VQDAKVNVKCTEFKMWKMKRINQLMFLGKCLQGGIWISKENPIGNLIENRLTDPVGGDKMCLY
jgi:hypothetical protein